MAANRPQLIYDKNGRARRLNEVVRLYWIDNDSNEVVRHANKTLKDAGCDPLFRYHYDYGKPVIDLDRRSHFDSLGNYGDSPF